MPAGDGGRKRLWDGAWGNGVISTLKEREVRRRETENKRDKKWSHVYEEAESHNCTSFESYCKRFLL